MGIGKLLVIIFIGLIILAGVAIALQQTKSVQVEEKPGNTLLDTLTWFVPKHNSSTIATTTFPQPKQSEPQPQAPEKPKVTPPPGFSARDLSPFYGQVRISSVSPASPSDYGAMSSFELQANSENAKAIYITGWTIKTNSGASVFVPKALADYGLQGLADESPIGLSPGDYANFYRTDSAVRKNFRLNICMGYLNNAYGFTPSLPYNCPLPYSRGEAVNFPGDCQSFLYSLGSCRMVSAADRNRFSGENYGGCQSVLDRFNYGYCYNHSRTQADFFSHEWRIWIGKPMPFDTQHDQIRLLDNAGLLVDVYTY